MLRKSSSEFFKICNFSSLKYKKMKPQFSRQQRNFLAFEYHKHKGTRGFRNQILVDFQAKFPGVRVPTAVTMRRIWEKQMLHGTVNNCNNKKSPSPTNSGRKYTVRTARNKVRVKNLMDTGSVKHMGDRAASPVRTTRKNGIMSKSSWHRIKVELKYHPY